MARITAQTQVILYTGSPVSISEAAWVGNIDRIFRQNNAGTGWVSYKQGSQFSLVNTLEPGQFYIILSKLATPNFDLPGADIGPAVTTLSISPANLDAELAALLNEKASLSQVQQVVVQAVAGAGGRPALTPFTPPALGPALALWLDAGDAATVTASPFNWQTKGTTPLSFVPVEGGHNSPQVAASAVVFASSPLVSTGVLPVLGEFMLMVIAEPDAVDVGSMLFFLAGVLRLEHNDNMQFTGWVFPANNEQMQVGAGAGKQAIFISRQQAPSQTRLSVNGGVSSRVAEIARQTIPSSTLALGGYRSSDNVLHQTYTGKLYEVVLASQFDLPTLRKLEGYCRVRSGIVLPPSHPYAAIDPVVEDTDLPNYEPFVI